MSDPTTIWQHRPITALCALEADTLLVGMGNLIDVFHITSRCVLLEWSFKRFVVIHTIEALLTVSKEREYLLSVSGNRFFAVLRLNLNKHHLGMLFVNYQCDNIIYNSLISRMDDIFLYLLSSHSELRILSLLGSTARDISTIKLMNMVCYSGHLCSVSRPSNQLLVFLGMTFGKIRIFSLSEDCNFDSALTGESTLSVQKGVIFCVHFCHLSSVNDFRLASCAEDRSIAIWSNNSDDLLTWNLVYHLRAGGISNFVFDARIWCVRIGCWGLIAVGENCRIAHYHWESISKVCTYDNVHRGLSIWCITVWFDKRHGSYMMATGGSDGAICVRELSVMSEKVGQVTLASICTSHISDNLSNTSDLCQHMLTLAVASDDFIRSLFFGSNGRLFFITNCGYLGCYSTQNNGVLVQLKFCSHLMLLNKLTEVLSSQRSSDGGIHTSNWSIKQSDNMDNCFTYPELENYHSLFCGHSVCATNPCRDLVLIGNLTGRLLLAHILSESPYLAFTDCTQLTDKIMEIIWISNSNVIIGLQDGTSVYISFTFVESVCRFSKWHLNLLPVIRSQMCWATAACELRHTYPVNNMMKHIAIIGTRDGGIFSYLLIEQNDNLLPVWCQRFCHGRGGCTCFLVCNSNDQYILYSCGRTYGDIKYWSIDLNANIQLLGNIKRLEQFTWIRRFVQLDTTTTTTTTTKNEIFALGFQSVNFKVIKLNHASLDNLSLNSSIHCPIRADVNCCYTIACGGSNRVWDWYYEPVEYFEYKLTSIDDISSNYFKLIQQRTSRSTNFKSMPLILFASINRGRILLQSDMDTCLNRDIVQSKGLLYLKPSLHGRDINCCLSLLSCSSNTTSGKSTHNLICITGGEDRMLCSWCIPVKQLGNLNVVMQPRYYYGHISNIRCLTRPKCLNEDNHLLESTQKYLLTGGGRGQLCVWRLNWTASGILLDLTPFGLLGEIRLRSYGSSYTGVVPSNLEGDFSKRLDSTDLRIMALDSLQLTGGCGTESDNLLLFAACSDGFVRLIHIQLQCNHEFKLKFNEPSYLAIPTSTTTHDNNQSKFCCFDVKISTFTNTHISVMMTNSRGQLHHWLLKWALNNSFDTTNTDFQFEIMSYRQLIAIPIKPFNRNTFPVFGSITQFKFSDSDCVLIGADDGSVRVAVLTFNPHDIQWIKSDVKHYSSVIKLHSVSMKTSCVTKSHCLSLGSDQRLILWSFQYDVKELSALKCLLLSGIGDPHDFSVFLSPDDDNFHREDVYALVVGTGAAIVRLS